MNTTRAAAYYRVSTDRQAEADRHSLEAQRAAFTRHCADRGHEAVAEYQDVESGRKVAREAYQQMLTDARAGRFDVIIVSFLDRFGRNQWETMARLAELHTLGVEVEAVYEDTREFVMVALSAWKAQQESERIGARVKMTSQRAVQSGRPLGAFPYGYRRFRNDETWGIVVNDGEAEVVRSIFRWYVVDALSMAQIRTRLNERGVPAPRGAHWSAESVANVLTRRTYYGDFTYGETTVPGMVPAIIDRETFDLATARRERRKALNPRVHRSDYLLSGLAYCAHCGGRMEGNTTSPRGYGPYRRYSCANYRKTQTCTFRNQHDADALESAVVADLVAAFQQPIDRSERDVREVLGAELASVERRLTALPGRFLQNMRLFESGAIASEAQLALANQSLDTEQQTLTASRATLRAALDDASAAADRTRQHDRLNHALAAEWPGMDVRQRKALLQELIERVEVTTGEGEPVTVLRAYSAAIPTIN